MIKLDYLRKKKIWVEAESIKVGKLNIPPDLKAMPLGRNIKLSSSLNERVKDILKDYKYFTSDPDLMNDAIRVLKKIIPREDFINIEKSLIKKEYHSFVKALIIYHYDKAYKKTRAEKESKIYAEIILKKIDIKNIKEAIVLNNHF